MSDKTHWTMVDVLCSKMTLRDWLAGMALNGMMSYSRSESQTGNWMNNASCEDRAKFSYDQADAMLRERRK